MKKSMFLLGALITVSMCTFANEADIVEDTVFKPSGKLGLEYKAYGKTEGHGDKERSGDTIITPIQDVWNRGANNYSRLESKVNIDMTENSNLEIRVRDYNNLDRDDESSKTKKTGTETRARYTYQHTPKFASRLEYEYSTKNEEYYEYRGIFELYKNKNSVLSNVILEPYYAYEQPTDNGGDYFNSIGTKIQFLGDLFAGFTYEFNTYFNESFYNHDFQTGKDSFKNKEFTIEIEAYIYNSIELYSSNNYVLDFNFEGGYDPYTFAQYGRYDKKKKIVTDKNEYTLYAEFDLELTYNITPSLSVSGGVGAKYENWDHTAEKSARDWRWQPFAYLGTNVKF